MRILGSNELKANLYSIHSMKMVINSAYNKSRLSLPAVELLFRRLRPLKGIFRIDDFPADPVPWCIRELRSGYHGKPPKVRAPGNLF